MAGRKKTGHELPKEIFVTVAGPPGKPYYTVVSSLDNIVRDIVVGVYRLKRKRLVQVTRELKKIKER